MRLHLGPDMSPLEAIDSVFASNLHGAVKAVAIVVARRDGAKGCFAGMTRIAHEAGVTVRGARKAMADLEALGIITVEEVIGSPSIRRMDHTALAELPARVKTRKTPEPRSPVNHVPPPREPRSSPPVNHVPPPREPRSSKEAVKGQKEEAVKGHVDAGLFGEQPKPPRSGMAAARAKAWKAWCLHHPLIKRDPFSTEAERIDEALRQLRSGGSWAGAAESLCTLLDWFHLAPDACYWQGDNDQGPQGKGKKYLAIKTLLKKNNLPRIDEARAWKAEGSPKRDTPKAKKQNLRTMYDD